MAKVGKPRALPPKVWALVVSELDAGTTYEKVQAELLVDGYDVSISTMCRYRREDRRKLRAAGKLPGATPEGPAIDRLEARASMRNPDNTPVTAEPLAETADLLTMLRRQYSDAAARCERARGLGDAVVASRESKVMAEISAQIGRAEKIKQASRDVMTFSRAEIDAGMRTAREKVRAVVQRPLQCAGCARSLAAALVGVTLDP